MDVAELVHSCRATGSLGMGPSGRIHLTVDSTASSNSYILPTVQVIYHYYDLPRKAPPERPNHTRPSAHTPPSGPAFRLVLHRLASFSTSACLPCSVLSSSSYLSFSPSLPLYSSMLPSASYYPLALLSFQLSSVVSSSLLPALRRVSYQHGSVKDKQDLHPAGH